MRLRLTGPAPHDCMRVYVCARVRTDANASKMGICAYLANDATDSVQAA